jgi:GNAT superfamily N-acetyltransferase
VSLTEVPAGQLAAVVTYLEMRERPALLDVPASPLSLSRVAPSPDAYRELFRAVGARWRSFYRLLLSDDALASILGHPAVELFEVRAAGGVAGMLELDRRQPGQCELSFLGLLPEHVGRGHGRWLLAEAVRRAWDGGTTRVHVHTCTLDHPAALGAYRRAGFRAVERKIETFIDPRLAGILPRETAPQVPLIEPASS